MVYFSKIKICPIVESQAVTNFCSAAHAVFLSKITDIVKDIIKLEG